MVLRHLSTGFLMKCSVYISVGGITSAFVMREILLNRIRREEYFTSAMKIVKNHEGAKSILGKPIMETSFEYGKPNYVDDTKAYFEVKVKGPKDKGIVYFWAYKKKDDEHWDVFKVELQLKDDDSKRLVIKNTKPSVVNATEFETSSSPIESTA